MPANVTIEFQKAKEKYEQARTSLEKLLALQEMQRTAPSHKGGENLRREISRKIAQVKRGLEKQKEQAKKIGRGPSLGVKKEGAGQIAIIGLPNSGKSTFLKALTNADVEIAAYPFTTKKPEVGMAGFKGAKIQLVEVPALVKGSSQGKFQGMQLLSLVRNADALIALVNSIEEMRVLKEELRQANIWLNQSKPKIIIKRSKFPGISLAGKKFLKVKEEELIQFLKNLGYFNAEVVLEEETTLAKVAQVLDEKIVYKRCWVITKNSGIKGELEKISQGKVINLPDLKNKESIEGLKKKLLKLLRKILVYTKKPGQPADYNEPLVLDEQSTVGDIAKLLHKEFAEKLRYVKVWGSAKFPGQRVPKNYQLKNEDLIEIYS